LLSDGQWHEIREIKEKMKLEEGRIQQIVAFLREYDFILVEETKKAIKIEAVARDFLTQKASS